MKQDTSHGRRARKQRKASGIYKLEPLFGDAEKDELTINETSWTIDGRLGDFLVVSVPVTTSRASALALEGDLTKAAKKPVLVVTHNMSFLRATLLTGKEKAELAKIIAEATKEEVASADTPQP